MKPPPTLFGCMSIRKIEVKVRKFSETLGYSPQAPLPPTPTPIQLRIVISLKSCLLPFFSLKKRFHTPPLPPLALM